jgi:hypothetical protein
MKNVVKNFTQFVNESWDPSDAFSGETSNCCGAPIVMGDICSDCKEHCEAEEEEYDERYDEYPEDRVDDPEFEPHNREPLPGEDDDY